MEIELNEITRLENIIDIRSKNEYNKKNINNSINIPRMLLMSEPSKYLKKKNIYYIVCDKGELSLFCAKILRSLGYNCYSIKNGMQSIK